MKFSSLILAFLGIQVTISTGFMRAHGENTVSPLASGHRRSNQPAIHRSSDIKNISAGISHGGDLSSDETGAYVTLSDCTSVTGTIVIPTISVSLSGTTVYDITAWVGLDGITTPNSMLQVGLDIYVEGGVVDVDTWYEWYPDYAYVLLLSLVRRFRCGMSKSLNPHRPHRYYFSGLQADVGDSIRFTATATSTTSGTALVENLTTGQSASHSFSGQTALEEVNAEWIVEELYDSPVTGITFQDASATCSSKISPLSATILRSSDATVSTTSNSVIINFETCTGVVC